ncbi:MAG: ankyrin repeat domain-containing protein [Proteobacteria bacterium]|nr:ankyrin repeat domain-containing protein [Pseudomonadota bacterium]
MYKRATFLAVILIVLTACPSQKPASEVGAAHELDASANNEGHGMAEFEDVPEEVVTAAWGGNLKIVKRYVQQGGDPNRPIRNYSKPSLLIVAAGSGHAEMVRFLLENGADVKAADELGKTALHGAADQGYLDIVKMLVEKGADVNAYSKVSNGLTPLQYAAGRGSMETVEYLLENGAKVAFGDSPERSFVLVSAAQNGHAAVFKYLASRLGVELDWQYFLNQAIFGGSLELVKFLVEEKKVDVRAKCDHWRITPMERAAHNNFLSSEEYVEILKFLRTHGGDLRDINGGDIFPWAMENSNEATIVYFREQGIKSDAPVDQYGWPPLPATLDGGQFALAQTLIGSDKDPQFRNQPLVVFFADGLDDSHQIIEFLIKNKLNTNHYAAAYWRSVAAQDPASVMVLLAAGVDVNAKGGSLAMVRDYSLAKFLLSRGIDTSDPKIIEAALSNFGLLRAIDEAGLVKSLAQDQSNKGLCQAARLGDLEVVRFFLNKGAKVDALCSGSPTQKRAPDPALTGRTALIENAIQGIDVSPEITLLLLRSGANPNLADGAKRTAVHYAVLQQDRSDGGYPVASGNRRQRERGAHKHPLPVQRHRSVLILKALIDAGADINLQDAQGNTPLILAAQNKHYEAMRILLEANANTAKMNKKKKTVFDYALDDQAIKIMNAAGVK